MIAVVLLEFLVDVTRYHIADLPILIKRRLGRVFTKPSGDDVQSSGEEILVVVEANDYHRTS